MEGCDKTLSASRGHALQAALTIKVRAQVYHPNTAISLGHRIRHVGAFHSKMQILMPLRTIPVVEGESHTFRNIEA
jgi:hypothetical protein